MEDPEKERAEDKLSQPSVKMKKKSSVKKWLLLATIICCILGVGLVGLYLLLAEEKLPQILERGLQDNTTMAHVSVMVYYTPAFKELYSDGVLGKIYAVIKEVNRIFGINAIPVQLNIFCIEELEGQSIQLQGRAKKTLLSSVAYG